MTYFGNTHPLYQEVLVAQQSVKMDLKRDDDKIYEAENQRFEQQRRILINQQIEQEEQFKRQIEELEKKKRENIEGTLVEQKDEVIASIDVIPKPKTAGKAKMKTEVTTFKSRGRKIVKKRRSRSRSAEAKSFHCKQ